MTPVEKKEIKTAAAEPKIPEPEYRVVRFQSEMRGIRYTCVPKRGKEYFNPQTYERVKEILPGKYIFTDAKGFVEPTDDPDILRWYLKHPTYQYELVCLWGDKEPPRPFGQALGTKERKRIEDLIAWKEAGN